jgi:hypothetical protein
MVHHQQALHRRTLDQQMALHARALRRRAPAGNGRRATNDDASAHREVLENGIADRARGVVEVDVDAVGTGR